MAVGDRRIFDELTQMLSWIARGQPTLMSSLGALCRLLEAVSGGTGAEHDERLFHALTDPPAPLRPLAAGLLSLRMGLSAGMERQTCLDLALAGVLDPGDVHRLTEERIRHPVGKSLRAEVLHLLRCRNERLDGSGPAGLCGDELDSAARVLAAACAYIDRLAEGWSGVRTLALIHGERSLFDEKAAARLIAVLSVYPIGSYVALDSGEKGRVVGARSHDPLHPIVCVRLRADGSIIEPPILQDQKDAARIVSLLEEPWADVPRPGETGQAWLQRLHGRLPSWPQGPKATIPLELAGNWGWPSSPVAFQKKLEKPQETSDPSEQQREQDRRLAAIAAEVDRSKTALAALAAERQQTEAAERRLAAEQEVEGLRETSATQQERWLAEKKALEAGVIEKRRQLEELRQRTLEIKQRGDQVEAMARRASAEFEQKAAALLVSARTRLAARRSALQDSLASLQIETEQAARQRAEALEAFSARQDALEQDIRRLRAEWGNLQGLLAANEAKETALRQALTTALSELDMRLLEASFALDTARKETSALSCEQERRIKDWERAGRELEVLDQQCGELSGQTEPLLEQWRELAGHGLAGVSAVFREQILSRARELGLWSDRLSAVDRRLGASRAALESHIFTRCRESGLRAFREGRLDEARAGLRRALSLRPDSEAASLLAKLEGAPERAPEGEGPGS